jgi:hypothetical protein
MPTKLHEKRPKKKAAAVTCLKSKTQKSASGLLASSKLSDYHILRILRFFAEGASPAHTSRHVRISYVTIQRIFDMARKRLLLLGFYMPFEDFVEMMDSREDVKGYWDKSHFLSYIDRKMKERKGVTAETLPFHRAELSYRYVEEAFEEPGSKPTGFPEMLRLLRISGPLNRPPDIDRTIHALEFGLGRFRDRHRRWDREVRVILKRWQEDERGAKQ